VRVFRFHKDEANLIELDNQSYLVHRNRVGAYILIRANCPHRGGPLFLGTMLSNGSTESIRCPWHDSVVSVQAMEKKAPPMVVNGVECRVVINDTVCEYNIRWVRTLLDEHTNETPCHATCT
jgi:nitrite reductase/ring-hydroxylating ferredoxin subunit